MSTKTPPRARALTELVPLVEACEGFTDVVQALRRGDQAAIDGTWGSACALAAAALARHAPAGVVLVVPHVSDVDDLADDLATFSGITTATFPAWESTPGEQLLADEVFGQRLRLLKALDSSSPPRIIVTSIQALLQPVPSREQLAASTRTIRVGDTLDLDELLTWLVERGFHGMSAVELPGEFSRRGGILDVFALDAAGPVRIELFGDTVESIRRFDVANQRSIEELTTVALTVPTSSPPSPSGEGPGRGDDGRERRRAQPTDKGLSHFCHYLPAGTWFALLEPRDLKEQ
jgi:transcription-repair coupling factor (superfamily II helicase)